MSDWLKSFDRAMTHGEMRTIDNWPIISCQERGRHLGTLPNVVVLDSRETQLVILSTRAGEYARTSDFDVRWIDPASICVRHRV